MSLHKLARELDETARQTAGMVEAVTAALEILGDKSVPADEARRVASHMIIQALQGQDRIEQRSQGMAHAVRQFILLPPGTPDEVYDEIWGALVLDELRVPGLAGTATHGTHGEAELF
jgi:hypothetical protein